MIVLHLLPPPSRKQKLFWPRVKAGRSRTTNAGDLCGRAVDGQ